MKIYFAGSIRAGREDAAHYAYIIELLKRHGTVLTEHIGNSAIPLHGESLPASDIFSRDMAWLTDADAFVAEVTVPSLGVGYEIAAAERMQKPALCLFPLASFFPL